MQMMTEADKRNNYEEWHKERWKENLESHKMQEQEWDMRNI